MEHETLASHDTHFQFDCLIIRAAAWWSFCCLFFGFFLASIIFYYRQHNLLLLISSLEKDKSQIESSQYQLTSQYDKFKSVASQILVPFPLDQLVEKAAVEPQQLMEISYKPRQLLANRQYTQQG